MKPDNVKITQIVSNTIPRPGKVNAVTQELQPGSFSLVIYGLGDDGNLYFFNHHEHKWENA